jgi:transposase-like protein
VPAAKYTPEQRAEALALYETHGPTAVTDQLGIPKQTVQDWAKAAGVRTVRTARTREATEARAVDLKASRQELAALLLADAHKLRKQLWEPAVVHAFGGKDNTYEEHQLEEPTFTDKKNIISAVSTAMTTVVKLDAVDAAPADGAAGAVSVIDKLMAGFTQVYEAGK